MSLHKHAYGTYRYVNISLLWTPVVWSLLLLALLHASHTDTPHLVDLRVFCGTRDLCISLNCALFTGAGNLSRSCFAVSLKSSLSSSGIRLSNWEQNHSTSLEYSESEISMYAAMLVAWLKRTASYNVANLCAPGSLQLSVLANGIVILYNAYASEFASLMTPGEWTFGAYWSFW